MADEFLSAFGFAQPGQIVIGPTPVAPPPPPLRTEVTQAEWNAMIPWGRFAPAPARALNRASTSAPARQLTLAAENAPIRLIYGRDRVGAQIVNALAYNNKLWLQCLWGYAIDSVESIKLNEEDLPAGTTRTDHYGTQVAADTDLVAAFNDQGITYTDTLNGFAYTVLGIPIAKVTGGLSVTGIIKGRKVYDPRTTTTVWSDNPALCLRDFITNGVYGLGKSIDESTVTSVANWNDTDLGGGEKHRLIGWSIDTPTPVETIIETLRTYAGCFVVRRGATYRLIEDKAVASSDQYRHAQGEIQSFGNVEKRDIGNSPTVVEVVYTDTSKTPWRDRSAFAVIAGKPRRQSTVRLNGIHRYSQAYREAVERLNKLALDDLSMQITVFDKGIKHEVGDVVDISLPIGVASKPMRVTDVQSAGAGLYSFALTEYDPAAYNTSINTDPTYDDTALLSPGSPPTPTISSVVEELFEMQTGITASRLRITFTHATYLFVQEYRVELLESGSLVHSGSTTQQVYVTPAVQEGKTYTVRVAVLSTAAIQGDWASTAKTAAGKYLPPTSVTSITGFEVGGDVYLSWTKAIDIDIWRYELRYGTTGGSWETATVLDQVDALRYISKGVMAAGVKRIYVKALDSVGQYSATSPYVDITITLDPDALQTEAYLAYDSGNSSNVLAVTYRPDPATYYLSHFTANDFGTQFPNAMNTYTNELARYHAAGTSVYQTLTADLSGIQLVGDWNVEADITLMGTVTTTLQLSDDDVSYTDYTTLPVKAAARYAKVKISSSDAFEVKEGSVRVWCNAVTRKESGKDTSLGTGGKTITLTGKYSFWKKITITPYNETAARPYAINAITLHATNDNTFDVYIFDAGGTQQATAFNWTFEGV